MHLQDVPHPHVHGAAPVGPVDAGHLTVRRAPPGAGAPVPPARRATPDARDRERHQHRHQHRRGVASLHRHAGPASIRRATGTGFNRRASAIAPGGRP